VLIDDPDVVLGNDRASENLPMPLAREARSHGQDLIWRSALICEQKPARHRVTRFHLTVFTTQETDVGSIP
jgi:hypothetical protein